MKKIGKFIVMAVFGVIAIAIFGYVVMSLWNWLIPDLFGGSLVTYWQGLGLLLLAKIFFGGFGKKHCGCCHGGSSWKSKWKDRCSTMSPDEKEKMREQWKSKLAGWCTSGTNQSKPTQDEQAL